MDKPQIVKRHVRKWGNGLGILLPRAIVKELGIEAGDELEFDVDNGQIIFSLIQKKIKIDCAFLAIN